MTKQEALNLGFEEIPTFTIGGVLIYPLGRNRHLSFSNIGTANEFLFINESDSKDVMQINESVCLHNYDYDGLISIDELTVLMAVLNKIKY